MALPVKISLGSTFAESMEGQLFLTQKELHWWDTDLDLLVVISSPLGRDNPDDSYLEESIDSLDDIT